MRERLLKEMVRTAQDHGMEAVLDTVLNILEEHRDEWDLLAHEWADSQDVRDLIGAGPLPWLRVLRSS